jgi:hypothetical protein
MDNSLSQMQQSMENKSNFFFRIAGEGWLVATYE